MNDITNLLKEHQDEKNAAFVSRLTPGMEPAAILGVRTPVLRKLAKELKHDERVKAFLLELPHHYFEENQLHGFLISDITDFQSCIAELEHFLPFMDNWATCDQTSPKIFKKHRDELLPYIHKWLASSHTYTVRFAIGMLMKHFLDEDFKPEYLQLAAGIRSEEYYINMEIAWYLATALAKQWEATIPWIEEGKLEKWVHNKTIQKAIESYRIPAERKEYLRQLRKK